MNMKIVQEKQQLKTNDTTQISGYAHTMQIKQRLKVEENVNMETEASNFLLLLTVVNISSYCWQFN